MYAIRSYYGEYRDARLVAQFLRDVLQVLPGPGDQQKVGTGFGEQSGRGGAEAFAWDEEGRLQVVSAVTGEEVPGALA